MNPHIELVKKWLDDPKSVSAEELELNSRMAGAVSGAVSGAASTANAAAEHIEAAEFWVNKYEELTK